MICDNCKKHIERKFLSKGKTINCLNYTCERPYRNKGLIECTRDEVCDYIHEILQPERSKREDLNCNCHRCFQDNLLKNHYPWLYEQEMKAREGKKLCERIQDAVL